MVSEERGDGNISSSFDCRLWCVVALSACLHYYCVIFILALSLVDCSSSHFNFRSCFLSSSCHLLKLKDADGTDAILSLFPIVILSISVMPLHSPLDSCHCSTMI